MTTSDLQPLPEDWQRALAIVAHPDDLEYGAASAIARWTDQGRSVAYLVASRGEAGIDTVPPEQAGPLREKEQVAAAAVVGVDVVEFLDHPDGVIEYGVPLRRDIAEGIRRHRPELVITGNHRETFANGYLNMADHRNVGAAVLDAVRDAGNRWVFPEQIEAGLEPWGGVRWVALGGSPLASHAVDITATLDRGMESLRAHKVYLDVLGDDHPGADAGILRQMAEKTAERFGGRLAVSFELIPLMG